MFDGSRQHVCGLGFWGGRHRERRTMEAVHSDLTVPYEASMGGSVYLFMIAVSASKYK